MKSQRARKPAAEDLLPPTDHSAEDSAGETQDARQVPHTTFVCKSPAVLLRDPIMGELRSKRGMKHVVPTGGPMYQWFKSNTNAFKEEGEADKAKGAKTLKAPVMTRKFTPKA